MFSGVDGGFAGSRRAPAVLVEICTSLEGGLEAGLEGGFALSGCGC